MEIVSAPHRPAGASPDIYAADGRPRFFSDPAMDRFAASFAMLASEVWVAREQIATLTDILKKKGAVTAEDFVEAQTSAAANAARDSELGLYIKRVLGPLREPE